MTVAIANLPERELEFIGLLWQAIIDLIYAGTSIVIQMLRESVKAV